MRGAGLDAHAAARTERAVDPLGLRGHAGRVRGRLRAHREQQQQQRRGSRARKRDREVD
jgi:hypothetical protein